MEYQDTLSQFEEFEVMVQLSHPYDKTTRFWSCIREPGNGKSGLGKHALSDVLPLG